MEVLRGVAGESREDSDVKDADDGDRDDEDGEPEKKAATRSRMSGPAPDGEGASVVHGRLMRL